MAIQAAAVYVDVLPDMARFSRDMTRRLGASRFTVAIRASLNVKSLMQALARVRTLVANTSKGLLAVGAVSAGVFAGLGAGIAGVAAGFVGLGVTLAAQNAEIKSIFTDLFGEIKKQAVSLAQPFVGPLKQVAGVIKQTFAVIAPQLKQIFATLAPALVPLVQGLANMVKNLMPAFEAIAAVAAPMLADLGKAFGQLGSDLAGFFAPIVDALAKVGGDLFTTLFGGIGDVLVSLGPLLGALIEVGSTLLGPLLGAINTIVGALAGALGPLLRAIGPVFTQIVGALAPLVAQLINGLAPILTSLVPILGDVFTTLAPIISTLISAFQPVIASLVPVVGLLATALGQVLMAVAPLLMPISALVTTLVSTLLPVLFPVVDLISQMAAQIIGQLVQALITVMPSLIMIVEAVSSLLPALMPLIPMIGQLALAFIPLLPPMVEFIAQLVVFLVPIMKVLIGVIILVVGWLVGLLTNMAPLLPVILGLVAAMKVWAVIQGVLNVVMSANPITLIVIAIVALIAIVVYAYRNFGWFRTAVQAAWTGIQAAAQFAWNNIIKPVFDAIKFYIFNIVVPYFKLLWNIIKLAWAGIQKVIQFAWNNIIKPVFSAIKFYITAVVIPYFKLLWNIIKAVWAGISSAIKTVWNSGIRPIFDAIKSAIGKVGGAFRAGANAIKVAWAKIKEYAKAPVNFIIGTVYNGGIRKLWNSVMGWLHLPDSMKLGEVPMLAKGGSLAAPAKATPMMTNGPMAIVGEGRRQHPEFVIPTDPRYRSRAQGLWAQAGGHLQMLAKGGVLGSVLGGVKKLAGKASNLGKVALDLIANPRKVWDRLVAEMVPSAGHLASSPWGMAASKIPSQMLPQMWGAASQLVKAFASGYGGNGGAVVKAAASMIGRGDDRGENNNWLTRAWGWPGAPWCAMFVSEAIKQAGAAKRYPGTPSAAVATFNGRMRHIPTSQGMPGDLATYGSNDHINIIESKLGGMFRTIGGNEGPVVKRSIRGGQASVLRPLASGGIMARGNRHAFLERNLDPGDRRNPYAMLGLYDDGGYLPPGMSVVDNRTRRPEVVLNPRQWDIAERSMADGQGAPLIGTLVQQLPSGVTPEQMVNEVAFELRKVRRGGVHA